MLSNPLILCDFIQVSYVIKYMKYITIYETSMYRWAQTNATTLVCPNDLVKPVHSISLRGTSEWSDPRLKSMLALDQRQPPVQRRFTDTITHITHTRTFAYTACSRNGNRNQCRKLWMFHGASSASRSFAGVGFHVRFRRSIKGVKRCDSDRRHRVCVPMTQFPREQATIDIRHELNGC